MLKVLHTKYLLLIAIFLSCGLVQAATATPDTIAPTRVRVNELNPAPGAGYVPQSVYNGRAHWAQQVRVLTTPQPVPTLPPVLNATKSAVFSDVAGDTWYIDWMGRAHKLTVNPATLRDHDWYELPGFVPPDNIADFAWRTGNATIGGQLNPGLDIEFTVVDSSAFSAGGGGRGQILLKGAVKNTVGFDDYGSGRWNSIDASSGNLYFYTPAATPGIFVFLEGTGTPTIPVSGTPHFVINAAADYVQMNDYPNTRDDTGVPVNLLSTGAGGIVESHPIGESVAAKMREEIFTPTTGQTTFTIAYTAPAPSGTNVPVRVYRNGVRLTYTAAAPDIRQFTYTGPTITTASNLAGDEIAVEYFN